MVRIAKARMRGFGSSESWTEGVDGQDAEVRVRLGVVPIGKVQYLDQKTQSGTKRSPPYIKYR